MDDTAGLTAVLDATEALAAEPQPPEAFRWGEVSRLRVGRYRVFYTVAGDAVTIDRVDRVAR